MNSPSSNIDITEIEKFSQLAAEWWNPVGKFKTLHDINPLRLNFICQYTTLMDKEVVDVGCGGGILTESLAQAGAIVTGIDMAEKSLNIAHAHALQQNKEINYQQITVENLAQEKPSAFDVVVCMEMLEHVPDPASVIHACANLLKSGGKAFFSTLNRNSKSYIQAIIAAEHLLGMVPKGTHDFKKFITPAELARMGRHGGLEVEALSGMVYRPFTHDYVLCQDTTVNYLMCFRKAHRSSR